MANAFVEAVRKEVGRHFEPAGRATVAVCYDQGRVVEKFIREVVPKDVELVVFEGSYVAIRLTVERQDPELQRRWLIYVPTQPARVLEGGRWVERSPLRDYELSGARVELRIEEVLAQHFGLVVDEELRELLHHNGRELVERWEQAVGRLRSPLTKVGVLRSLLSLAFRCYPFDPGRVLLLYVCNQAEYREALERRRLGKVFSQLLRDELGLLQVPGQTLPDPRYVAAVVLLSELVEKTGLGEERFEFLPGSGERGVWVQAAEEWQRNPELQQYLAHWAREVERAYGVRSLVQGMQPEVLARVQGFPCVDELLWEEVLARVGGDGAQYQQYVAQVGHIAGLRENSLWEGHAGSWAAVHRGANLYSAIRAARAELQGIGEVGDFVRRYTDDANGWWRIDSLTLELQVSAADVEDEVWRRLVAPPLRMYTTWVAEAGDAFAKTVEREGSWVSEQQGSIRAYAAKERTAVLVVDALRFDLAMRLRGSFGAEVSVKPVKACLPSVTEVGMAALFSERGDRVEVRVEEDRLRVEVNGREMSTQAQRLEFLREKLGRETWVGRMDDLLRADEEFLGSTRNVIAAWDAIDEVGHGAAEVTPQVFLDVGKRLAHVIRKLHRVGFPNVAVVTDHGFLFFPGELGVEPVAAPPAAQGTHRSRRYALGALPTLDGCLDLTLPDAGLGSDVRVAFPRGVRIFSLPGKPGTFYHGGLSLQEVIVPCVEFKIVAPPQRVRVTVRLPSQVTSAFVRVVAEGERATLFEVPRRLALEVWAGKELLAKSPAVEVGEGQGTLTARLPDRFFAPPPDAVELRVVDDDTAEVLARGETPVRVVPRV